VTVVTIDARSLRFREIPVPPLADCPLCGPRATIHELGDPEDETRPLNPRSKETGMSTVTGLKCRECGTDLSQNRRARMRDLLRTPRSVYDYGGRRPHDDAGRPSNRARENLWRYKELLPIDGEPRSGFTRDSHRSFALDRLARELASASSG